MDFRNSDFSFNKVARILVEADCDVNRANKRGETPLITAAKMNCVDVARVLLTGECDVNRDDADRRTALLTAAEAGYTTMVETVIRASK